MRGRVKRWPLGAQELEAAIARARDHLSLYQLTIEYGTMFARLRDAGKLVLPDNDLARALWDVTQEVTSTSRPSRL